jgi:hypothetical protein
MSSEYLCPRKAGAIAIAWQDVMDLKEVVGWDAKNLD